jgi:hypothetical protein
MTGSAFIEFLGARSEPIWEMREALLRQLIEEKLEAWGIQTKPRAKKGPEKIPPYFFSGDPKVAWPKDSVENFGRRYEGVRVGRIQIADPPPQEAMPRAGTAPEMPFAQATPEPRAHASRKKPGPKSARDTIIQKYNELKAQGRLRNCRTLKEIYHILQPILAKDTATFPRGRGLAYSSFSRHLKGLATTP